MVPQAATKVFNYIYAIVTHSQANGRYGPIGVEGGEVYLVSEGPLAAVVSDVPGEKIRPERRHLAAQHGVHKQLMERGNMLPMSFGTMADGPGAIRRILKMNQAAFLDQLRRVEGKAEMSLRAVWDVTNIFEYFVCIHAELRRLRDELFAGGREPSHDGKIELGRLFDRILNEDRAAHTQRVLEVLAPRCSEIKEIPPRTEREVMNLACLVARDGMKGFEEGVFEAAKQFDDNFSFDYSGPWPPYNFADVRLQT
jgi:hypothetical protein